LSEAHKGYKNTEEHKRRIGIVNIGKVLTDEHKKKIRKTMEGRKLSKKHREHISEGLKGNKSKLGQKCSLVTKQKMSESATKAWSIRKAK